MSKTTKAPDDVRSAPSHASIPNDLELMLYADGELEADRVAVVEAYLAGTRAKGGSRNNAGAKLAALQLVSGLVQERALGAASPADGIADAVMARVASEPAPKAVGHQEAASGPKLRDGAGPAPRRAPANDNARGIFALAAIAVAAAAGMMIWGRTEPPSPPRTPEASNVVVEEPAAPRVVTPPSVAVRPDGAPKPEDGEHGVEVAAVDFGARLGTIFYVPIEAAASGATTTVVWLSDEAAGGD